MSKNTHTLTLAERIDTLIDDPEVNPEQVGQRLRLARRRAGFSQQELADALNVGRRTIYEWEIGERIPKKHLTRISQVLAVSRARLLTGRDDYYADLSELREMLAKSEAELAELRRQVRLMNERNADLAEAVESGFGALRQLVEERVARREETRSRLGSRPRAPE